MIILKQHNGISLGSHHHDRSAATRIMESISQKMHRNLLDHITKCSELSILVDSSTDIRNRNFMFVYIRAIENNRPQTYFYKALQTKIETASSLYNALVTSFQEDNIYNTIKVHLRGFSSDGAPTFLGRNNGLAKLLNDSTDHNLYAVHCLAHKLQLAVGHALDKAEGNHGKFQNTVNSIYSFYNNKSFKRKESLMETASALGEIFLELNYIHGIKWLSSERNAYEKVYRNYHSLMLNMKLISESKDFSNSVSSKPKAFYKTLTDARFITTLVFLIDILRTMETTQLNFQKSSSSLIGKDSVWQSMVSDINKYKVNNGVFLRQFVEGAHCYRRGQWTTCSVADLDDCKIRKQLGVDLVIFEQHVAPNHHNENFIWLPLSTLRRKIVDAISLELSHYFPYGSLQIFDVLNPSLIPVDSGGIRQFSQLIKPLALRFEFNDMVAASEFEELLMP